MKKNFCITDEQTLKQRKCGVKMVISEKRQEKTSTNYLTQQILLQQDVLWRENMNIDIPVSVVNFKN